MANQSYDFIVIGAGIVGLTVARELKKRHPNASIIVLEKELNVGKHASGRNSGVMHSGVYYGSDTLKAKFCSIGATRIREFAENYSIDYDRSGKVIIATSERDLPTIDRLLKNAQANGVAAERLDEAGVKAIEPHASPYQAGIYCPDTAVINSKAVLETIRGLLEKEGVVFAFGEEVHNVSSDCKKLQTRKSVYNFGFCFNCGGAHADKIARAFNVGLDYRLVPFKGIYYKLRPERNHLVKGNIYPVPDIDLPFLGVHLTRVISGEVYVGPTAIPALGRENYGLIKGAEFLESLNIATALFAMYLENKQNFRLLVHTEVKKYLKPYFLRAAQKLMKDLNAEDLVSCDKVGIRPQLINIKERTLEMDYILEKTNNSLHVLNAISPAFTCSFAFSEWIVESSEI